MSQYNSNSNTHTGSKKAKEVNNPIYEGPLYENVEEEQSSQPPPTSSTVHAMSTEFIPNTDNIYHSLPVNIPSGQGWEFESAVVVRKSRHPHITEMGGSEREREEEGEEGAYTIMSTPSGISFTPSREDRATWLVNRDYN